MKAVVLLLVLIFGIGISFGQTEDDDMLTVTIIDEDGNEVELPSEPHVPPNVTEDSPPPPTLDDPLTPTNLTVTGERIE